MAINFKKGSALSLGQTDKVAATTGATIVAGQVVRVANVNGVVEALAGASASPAPASDLLGFAINNTTDGDVIAAGKIGVFLLDGSSVVETDQAAATINLTNYPIGTPVTADTTGNVKVAGNGDKVIGQVEGVRNLPAVQTVNGYKVQGTAAFLGIKLTA
jgi:hypothetical protein